jgi:hypothetical protein
VKTIGVVAATLAIFVFVWFFISALIVGLAYFANRAGVGGGIFWGLNTLLVWILSPLAGAAVAVYAATTTFKSVGATTVFVAFVSVCASLICILFIFALTASVNGIGAAEFFLFLAQAVAIFIGAHVGRSLGVSGCDA